MFEHPSLFKEAISLVLDFVPLVGSGKSALECIRGKDLVTGEHINRWLAAGGIILGLVPFGKLLTKGEKSTQLVEKIAAKIVYDADSKQHLIEKMKRVIPTHAEEVDHRFIMEEISARVNPTRLKEEFGIRHDPLDPKSDMNLVHQYIVQQTYGGHAVHKHWISGGKKKLFEYLSEIEKKNVTSALDDADEAFEYLKTVLKHSKTTTVRLNGGRVGFANSEKKVIIIHNPQHQGTFYFDDDPIKALGEIYNKECR